ncbi:tRNA (adenosine(37)-N6)-threonylcarbamoyltransferase complex ATPase subunit type 1 TsaE [[Phormidium] sp. ETS-05]|uniref:tRNA (adenosine(37)-N6)-threonylcarbamoyltransferase complex ATPase subunit type 1 TsaE n=1 Tax=[Phormidium] sp. ETS-05 TaxID=222819 RepID=UPI0018EEFD18|nr:tRNA (adenosine(37)-N6)-threonylcarbamoyltransferase complex ATPase subunit type 1 TsaE [[Phormidium] sp. ETS-05]
MTRCSTILLPDAAATHTLGFNLGQQLPAHSILLLEGDLGAGKTTLVQGIGAGLGITSNIVSPTFTIIIEYTEGRLPLYHFDLYRLSPSEVAQLQPETYWEGIEFPPGIVAIEWPDRLPYLPQHYLRLHLTYEQHQRQAQLIPIGNFAGLPSFISS